MLPPTAPSALSAFVLIGQLSWTSLAFGSAEARDQRLGGDIRSLSKTPGRFSSFFVCNFEDFPGDQTNVSDLRVQLTPDPDNVSDLSPPDSRSSLHPPSDAAGLFVGRSDSGLVLSSWKAVLPASGSCC